jgi:hypothetical protein
MSEEQIKQQEFINSIIEKEIELEETPNKIINRKKTELNGYEIIHEHYYWKGYFAESLILTISDFAEYKEEELKDILYDNDFCEKDSEINIEYDSHNIYLHFNYRTPSFD